MLFVFSAPSGTGKTTVVNRILKDVDNVRRVITATTRPKREGEEEGVDYIFLSLEEFERGIEEGRFLEYAKVYGNYYGTPKEQVLRNEEEGYDSILVIDVQGAQTIKRIYPESVLVFLLPPSIEELKRRLLTRGYGQENLEERIKTARWEISCAKYFDYVVVNEFLDDTIQALENIILSARHSAKSFLKNLEKRVKDDKIITYLQEECGWR
ncbi:guanylate kinase [Thermocrinis sp.]